MLIRLESVCNDPSPVVRYSSETGVSGSNLATITNVSPNSTNWMVCGTQLTSRHSIPLRMLKMSKDWTVPHILKGD